MPPIDLTTPQGLLMALLFPVWAVMWFAAHVLNTNPDWEKLPTRTQTFILFGVGVLISLVAYGALHLIPGTVFSNTTVQEVYSMLYAIIVAFFSGQFGQASFRFGAMQKAKFAAYRIEYQARLKAVNPAAGITAESKVQG